MKRPQSTDVIAISGVVGDTFSGGVGCGDQSLFALVRVEARVKRGRTLGDQVWQAFGEQKDRI